MKTRSPYQYQLLNLYQAQEKKLEANEQDNSLSSSSTAYNAEELQMKPLPEAVVIEKILDDNDSEGIEN